MPKPDWHMHHKIAKPKDDNEYFERMSRVIFMAGLNWQVLEKKWPGIRKAFAGFDVAKVAKFQEPEIEELMMDPDVIRNLPKIRAIIANAKTFQAIVKDYDSMDAYLTQLHRTGGETALRQEIAKRFAFMGKGTTVLFLFSTGQDIPEATKEWQARHQS